MTQRVSPTGWRKRLVFNLLMFIGLCIAIEGLSFIFVVFNYGSLSTLNRRRTAALMQNPFNPGSYFETPMMIHPYVGAVMQPNNDGGTLLIEGRYRTTEFGFVDDDLPVHRRSVDQVIVGIVGGSVARQFSLNATDLLAEELSKLPGFAERSFKFVRLANNGYKQPQQLMIISYLMTLGAEFDLVINLDGFNEAALPGIDNIPIGVFSTYPRDWGKMIAGHASLEFIRRAGYVTYLRKQQRDEARLADIFLWRYSPAAQLIWNYRDQRGAREIIDQVRNMNQFTKRESTYCQSGPPQHFDSTAEMYEHCVNVWSHSSTLLHQLCAANGTRYFHFLQPNQYLPGSKTIGYEEASVAILPGHPYSAAVVACYPLMKAEGRRLATAGVAFTDLTDVFANHPEPIYSDICCHVKKEGDLIIARAMAGRIREFGPLRQSMPD
jgi:hypothetical protein